MHLTSWKGQLGPALGVLFIQPQVDELCSSLVGNGAEVQTRSGAGRGWDSALPSPTRQQAGITPVNTAVISQRHQTKVGKEAPLNQARQMRLLPLIELPS